MMHPLFIIYNIFKYYICMKNLAIFYNQEITVPIKDKTTDYYATYTF